MLWLFSPCLYSITQELKALKLVKNYRHVRSIYLWWNLCYKLSHLMLWKLHACLDQCHEVGQKCRAFVWGDNENQRQVHTVAWENICKPKAWGRLGLKVARNVKWGGLCVIDNLRNQVNAIGCLGNGIELILNWAKLGKLGEIGHWLLVNLTSKVLNNQHSWSLIFVVTIDNLWKNFRE